MFTFLTGCTVVNCNSDEDEEVKEENSTVLDHHPHHVVVVDMQPQFGPSLTSMAEEHDQQT